MPAEVNTDGSGVHPPGGLGHRLYWGGVWAEKGGMGENMNINKTQLFLFPVVTQAEECDDKAQTS